MNIKFAIKLVMAMTLIATTGFALSARAMETTDVQITRHASNKYWVVQSSDAQAPDGYLIGVNEAVVDQIDALDTKVTTYHCQMKARRTPLFNGPGLQTLMVYGLTSCHQ